MKGTLRKYCTQGNKGKADMGRGYSKHTNTNINTERTQDRMRPSGKNRGF
jgi:hypothetical protein